MFFGPSYLSPSILMSRGPSLLRENPLSAWSICMEEQPASRRTASTLPGFTFSSDSRTSSSLKRPSNGCTRPLEEGLAEAESWQIHADSIAVTCWSGRTLILVSRFFLTPGFESRLSHYSSTAWSADTGSWFWGAHPRHARLQPSFQTVCCSVSWVDFLLL